MGSSDYWQRFARGRVSRRRALKFGAVGLGGGAAILAGCGGGEDEGEGTPGKPPAGGDSFLTPTGADETPVYGGTLVTGTTTVFGGLDPSVCVDCYTWGSKLHGYLYSVDHRDDSYDAQIAEEMEQIDDVTYRWKMKAGVKFHDIDPTFGREVTADDVVYSYNRRRDDPTSQNDKQLLRDYAAGFEATDKYTFTFRTTRPYSPAFFELGNPTYIIVPREAIEKWGDLLTNVSGCGAYILEEFVRGERVRMRKNPDFYMEGLPYIDNRETIIIPDESTIAQSFVTKQTDIYGGSELRKTKIDQYKDIDGVVIRVYPNYWCRTIMMMVDRPPFDDIRVRTAVHLALDRQDFIDKMAFGEGTIAGPIVPDLLPWSLPQEEVDGFYKFDLTEAKQLLSAAGYVDGLTVELKVEGVADLTTYSEIFKAHLEKAGIRCNLVVQELGLFLAQTMYARNFEMMCYYNLPYDEPDRPLCQWFSKGQAGFSFSGYNNPVSDDWIWKQRSEFDPEKRQQIILDAQRFFLTEYGPQVTTHTDRGYVANWDWVHGSDQQRKGLRWRGQYTALGVTDWVTERH